ncbi:MAG: ROK family protein [Cellulomonadaceae bacterium]|jgi:polyphosphate glucokinase|nr:ROK family protein [Cellulomonadaceae bacterium]
MTLTLAVDCGGGGIKANVVHPDGTPAGKAMRVPTPYPLPPGRLIEVIAEIAAMLPPAERVTVGMPGMIRHGVVVYTPHYITRSGPRTKVVPELLHSWSGFAMREAVAERLGIPAIVLNDAEVHGAGLVSGNGLELVATLGTGLGTAWFDNGRLAPHLELSHAHIRGDLTYDKYIGEVERRRLGNSMWSRRVLKMIDWLRPVFWWDRLYLGGGNAAWITPSIRARMAPDVTIVPNAAALAGGARAWELPLETWG